MLGRILIACALAAGVMGPLVIAQPASPSTIDGVWDGSITDPDGNPRRFRFTFATDGPRVSGTVALDDRAVPLKDAWIRKQAIAFGLDASDRTETLLFVGLIGDAGIAFTVYRARGSELSDPVRFTATRPPAP